MRKAALIILAAGIVMLIPSFASAADSSLAGECAVLLSVPDDASSISGVYSPVSGCSLAITYKTVTQIFTDGSSAFSFITVEKPDKQNGLTVFPRGDPHFRYSVKLE